MGRFSQDIYEYAQFLAHCLSGELGISVPQNFGEQFVRHARRLGSIEYEDLGALVLLECCERRESRISEAELRKMIDRIRHKLARAARRHAGVAPADERITAPSQLASRELESRLSIFCESLSDEERTIFSLMYVDGLSPKQVASLLNISLATVYRRIADLKARFKNAAADQ
ncbi:MAG: sigma-70 family RNA polymerase sigma factor [Pirellulaceae bacterium]